MARGSANLSSILGGVDQLLDTPRKWLGHHRSVSSTLLGLVGLTVVALVLVPVRETIGAANGGLAMAIIVALVGFRHGLGPGVVLAVWAGLLFAMLHSVPHGLPRIESEEDALTAALLLLTGILAGLWHRREARLELRTKDAAMELQRLHRVAEASVNLDSHAEVMRIVANEIRALLQLDECHWEPGPPLQSRAELRHSGTLEGVGPDATPEEIGAALAQGAAIELAPAGRLVLVGTPGATPGSRELKVSVLLADYAAAVIKED